MIYTLVEKLYSLSPHSTMNFLSVGIPKGTLAPAATSFKRHVMLILLCLWHSQRNIPEFLCINSQEDHCTFTEETFVKVQLITSLRLINIVQSEKVNE